MVLIVVLYIDEKPVTTATERGYVTGQSSVFDLVSSKDKERLKMAKERKQFNLESTLANFSIIIIVITIINLKCILLYYCCCISINCLLLFCLCAFVIVLVFPIIIVHLFVQGFI